MGSDTTQRKWGWAYFLTGALGVVAWSLAVGADNDLSETSGLWLNASLLLMLAAFVLEPWYSGSGTSIANLLLVGAGVIAAGFEDHVGWWSFLLGVAFVGISSLAAGSLLDTRVRAESALRFDRLGRTLGSWRAVPFGLLVLSLATFNQPIREEWTIGAAAAVYCFGISAIRPERFFGRLSPLQNARFESIVAPPSEVVVVGQLPEGFGSSGRILTVFTGDGSAAAIVVGPVVVSGVASWRLYVPGVRSLLPDASTGAADRISIGITGPPDSPTGSLLQYSEYLADASCRILGTAVEGTSVAEMTLELAAETSTSIGQLFVTARNGRSIFWQITDAATSFEGWPEDRRRAIRASASQLGAWDAARLRFERSVTSPPPTEIAVTAPQVSEEELSTGDTAGRVRIGSVPGSSFPVLVDPAILGRHHAAVLGVTGTGKTHLTFSLIESLVSCGTRVLCADLTGQYNDRFPDASTVKSSELAGFLDDPAAGAVGICDFTSSGVSPVKQSSILIRAVYDHVRTLPRLEPSAPARFVVVMEEAHNFIPESFVIDDWGLKAEAQATSMIFMEARKFGLGFVVVTQRTAMITKSALSQCGSLFAFQSVDQTGLDYLEGLCGRTQVKSLPSLPDRTALVMGRALSSDAAVLMSVDAAAAPIH